MGKWRGPSENVLLGSAALATHRMTNTPTWRSWWHMHQRCTNPRNNRFKDYGGRGITVCSAWGDFAVFLRDMGIKPDGASLDRFPNQDGNYEPGNCRWATAKQQQNNIRSNRLITWQGETRTLAETARMFGMKPHTLLTRLDRGWPIDKALLTPLQARTGRS